LDETPNHQKVKNTKICRTVDVGLAFLYVFECILCSFFVVVNSLQVETYETYTGDIFVMIGYLPLVL